MFTFRAMNTDVTVSTDDEETATRVVATFADAERRFSRFRRDSELAQLNRACGPSTVSEPLFAALVRARRYFDLTHGLFDPAVGGVLAAFGYDRSFAPGALDRTAPTRTERAGSFLDIGLDPSTLSVDRPHHVQIDLGGMIKGATVDAAARHLGGRGAIDAGGDAILLGREPTRGEWLVDIEDPRNAEQVLLTVAVSGGAVATSAPNRRTWAIGDRAAHHLIDPRTHAPSASGLLQATVFSPRAELADVLAKTAFLLGSREGGRFVASRGATGAVLVGRDGEVIVSGQVRVREIGRA